MLSVLLASFFLFLGWEAFLASFKQEVNGGKKRVGRVAWAVGKQECGGKSEGWRWEGDVGK